MRLWVSIALFAAGALLVHPQVHGCAHDRHRVERTPASEAVITITVNPEARVSVSRSGELQPATACHRLLELPVRIVNLGSLTSSIEATLVNPVPEGISLMFPMQPLKGTREEQRVLRIMLKKPGLVDVTIVFRAANDIPDLGDRDRIHLLLRCI